ncbi:4361_t:CDS:2, partial [Gigaspora margarita]
MNIKYCIFDVDGLLLDTEDIYAESTREILKRYSKEYTPELQARCLGLNVLDFAYVIASELKLNLNINDFCSERELINKRKFLNIKPMPGAARNNKDLFNMFDNIICGDDVNNGKPEPDIFIKACEMLGNPSPKECLVFEDSINGVIAAQKANMR